MNPNKLFTAFSAMAALVLTNLALAESSGGLKIGYVDVDQVASRSRSIQDRVKTAEDPLKVKQDEMEILIRDYRKAQDDLKARRSVLSDDEARSQETKIAAMRDKLDAMKLEIDKQLRKAETEIMGPAVDRILETVRKVGKAQGYDLILRREVVLYGADALDITPQVIQQLDQEAASKKEEPTKKEEKKETTDKDKPKAASPTKTPSASGKGTTTKK